MPKGLELSEHGLCPRLRTSQPRLEWSAAFMAGVCEETELFSCVGLLGEIDKILGQLAVTECRPLGCEQNQSFWYHGVMFMVC